MCDLRRANKEENAGGDEKSNRKTGIQKKENALLKASEECVTLR